MLQSYIVTYDISDPKRLRRVFDTMRGYGQWLQLSVFRCELTERARVELCAALDAIIDHAQDQVLFVDIGPAEGRATEAIRTLGRPYVPHDRGPIVV
ncbi:MAG TPA: CRISPR-associated endonuclease Cas2 [Minicystis sp.]|nr:CRISPR-associated endonuclease Cas2 [Minicystis sp.]